MNENTFSLDLNGKVVIDISRYEELLDNETRITVLEEYLNREKFIATDMVRLIFGMPEPPKEETI